MPELRRTFKERKSITLLRRIAERDLPVGADLIGAGSVVCQRERLKKMLALARLLFIGATAWGVAPVFPS